jgi:replicative DNA helicase
MDSINFNKFISIDKAVARERSSRSLIKADRVPRYNLKYLDELLIGIAPSELVVIGADTGQGKSWMANHIAYTNAKAGRKVYLFSLEGHKDEFAARCKWRIILREYYKNPSGKDMTFTKYQFNMIPDLQDLEQLAEEEFVSTCNNNLMLFDRSVSCDIEVLTQQLGLIQDADLVIIDHLHYLDMIDDVQETQHLSQIMKKVKYITEEKNTPVVMISHLRKKMGKRGLPDNEDFHGSSNIPKIATTCVLLSSYPERHKLSEDKYSTIIRVSKSRAGASTTIAAECFFDGRKQDYEPTYALGKVIAGEYKDLESGETPYWAKPKEKDFFETDEDL